MIPADNGVGQTGVIERAQDQLVRIVGVRGLGQSTS